MAITAALFKGYERTGNAYRIRVLLTDSVTGNSERWLTVTGSTLGELTAQASTQLAALVTADTQKDLLANIAVDTVIPLAPTAPAGPTAGELADIAWLQNARLLVRVKAAQSAGMASAQLTTDLVTLTTIVNSGYTTARALKL